MRVRELFEDQPARSWKPDIVDWLRRAYARPDVNDLYLHGSRSQFDVFKTPNAQYGQLIFFSKLSEYPAYENTPLQAEYYGPNLYLVKLGPMKLFDASYVNSEARKILVTVLPEDTWEHQQKTRMGRLDYQDLHLVVPTALQYGYEMFRVFEVSMGGDSYGITNPQKVSIIDKHLTETP